PCTSRSSGCSFLFSLIPPPPPSTLFPYTTLFRSAHCDEVAPVRNRERAVERQEVAALAQRPDHVDAGLRAAAAAEDLDRVLGARSEEHTSELQSPYDLVCRLLLEKKKQ